VTGTRRASPPPSGSDPEPHARHHPGPATVANLGPGFDILALALQLQNEIEAWSEPEGGISIDPGPDSAEELRDPVRNLITRAFVAACADAGVAPPGVRISCRNAIPFGRGLGSSAAAALSGVLAANALANLGWDEQQVIARAAEIEGHPDNVAAAMLGGLVVCAGDGPVTQVHVPDELRAVLFVPDGEMSTKAARQVVPTPSAARTPSTTPPDAPCWSPLC